MKKMIVLIAVALLAFPVIASADLTGQCNDCHTMHNSEQGSPVVATAQPNLLKFTCLGCHAQAPTTGGKNWVGPGLSSIPQVAHGAQSTDPQDQYNNLSGGNFNQTTARKMHSVIDVVNGIPTVPGEGLGDIANNEPPGTPHSSSRHVFTSDGATQAFDEFTCAGARGCHGTRNQIIVGATVDNGTDNVFESTTRTGIAAISGSHHENQDGSWKTSTGYNNSEAVHDGATVAAGYRFIVGLFGYENTAREYVADNDRNEYYANVTDDMGGGCGACHVQNFGEGTNQRMSFESGIKSINNSMSGFCSSCHGNFHSSGGGDYTDNGTSGAFLRHPSDWVIPSTGEYAAYTNFDPTAPIAKTTTGAAPSATVIPGTDAVGCLSCHVAHGSPNDYMLRFDYAAMTAGTYADETAAQVAGGCLACHTDKGVLPQNRIIANP